MRCDTVCSFYFTHFWLDSEANYFQQDPLHNDAHLTKIQLNIFMAQFQPHSISLLRTIPRAGNVLNGWSDQDKTLSRKWKILNVCKVNNCWPKKQTNKNTNKKKKRNSTQKHNVCLILNILYMFWKATLHTVWRQIVALTNSLKRPILVFHQRGRQQNIR